MYANVNVETGEVTLRDLTAEEIEQRKQEHEALIAQETAKEAARQALLDKLGITADEVKLLLG
jgi:hypothetical protein